MSKKFIRTDYWRMSKLGKRRRKLQVWRRARGKHSKMRRRRKGYPAIPMIGYKGAKKDSGKVKGLTPVLVNNMSDLQKVKAGHGAILSSTLGARKRMEMIKKAESMKIKILNMGGAK
jgi:large subunit ribosomal protein L32e